MRIKLFAVAFLIAGHWSYAANGTAGSTVSRSPANNMSKSGDIGVGVRVGELTGLTGELWTNERRAVDLSLAFNDEDTAISAAHLWHFKNALTRRGHSPRLSQFVPYVGVGLIGAFGTDNKFFIEEEEDFGLAAQLPIGIQFLPTRQRFGVFAEVAPSVGLVTADSSFTTADVGARFYF